MLRFNQPSFPLLLVVALVACSKGTAERGGIAEPETRVEVDPRTLPDTMIFEDTPVGRHGRLSVEGSYLVDEQGDPIQLRGISSMWLNWEKSGYALSYAAMQWMRDQWGITLFRAAMGVMDGERAPAAGGYLTSPATMENQVDQIVQNATELGVYVLIDWHDHFAQDSTEEAKEFFQRKAAQHKDNPSVIYEVFNEPVPRVWGTDDTFSWEDDFKPYHEELVETIREQDPEGVIILGTPFWSQNVDEAAADPVEGDNLMYTLHFYSCTHDEWLREKAQAAVDSGLPIFVTEWGATDASGGVDDQTVCDEEADRWHDFMNANYISWAAWKLDDCDNEASCILQPGASRAGGWDDEWLQGHGPYVVDKLLSPLPDGESPRPVLNDVDAGLGGADGGEPVLDAATHTTPDSGGNGSGTEQAEDPATDAGSADAAPLNGAEDPPTEAGVSVEKPAQDGGARAEPDAALVKTP